MVSITLFLLAHALLQVITVLLIYLQPHGTTRQNAEQWFHHARDGPLSVVIVLAVFFLLDIFALSLIAQLLCFHQRLRKEGLTTYQFIVRENQRKREDHKVQYALSQRRKAAMAKAHEDGRWILWYRLRMGGYLRQSCGLVTCDPLPLHPPEEEEKKESEEEDPVSQTKLMDEEQTQQGTVVKGTYTNGNNASLYGNGNSNGNSNAHGIAQKNHQGSAESSASVETPQEEEEEAKEPEDHGDDNDDDDVINV